MFKTEEIKEKVILVSIDEKGDANEVSENLEELALLADTGGALVVGSLTQSRENRHPAHYIGKGKIDELKDLVSLKQATGVICDDELSNTQIKNMEKMLNTKVIDRTMLILDIFAGRANTAEGKVQVELAQQKYNLSHLAGIGMAMSRLGGGIGTRGPGEKKLETDRRHIHDRIAELSRELKGIEAVRGVQREKREKNGIPIVSLVGYTNAGKSTLMNALTDAGVYVENKLFATLDTTTRKLSLPGREGRANGADILLTDTVGFIRKLPHNLIQAFRATLEELKYADILLHVIDASSITAQKQAEVVYRTLEEIGVIGKPIITVYNKIDRPFETPLPTGKDAAKSVRISALTGQGLPDLTAAIEEVMQTFSKKIAVLIPYAESRLVNQIHGNCEILCEEHREEGTYLELYAKPDIEGRLRGFVI